jgi:hypothetical protein
VILPSRWIIKVGFLLAFKLGLRPLVDVMHTRSFLLAFVLLLFATSSFSEELDNLCFAKILSDNVVLQQGKSITVWGWAKPGTQVEVTITQYVANTLLASSPSSISQDMK